LTLVRLVHEEQIWRAPHGTKGEKWDKIAKAFSVQLASNVRQHAPTVPTCQEKYNIMVEAAGEGHRTSASRSGDSEEYEEIDQLALQCYLDTKEFERLGDEAKAKDAAKQHRIEQTQCRLRDHTLKNLAHRHRGPASSAPASSSSSPSPSPPPASSSSSSSSSPSASPVPSQDDEPAYKRSRPSVKLQRESLETQREAVQTLREVGDKMVEEAALSRKQFERSNDLLERWMERQ
jgi:hypothetical protein